MSYNFDSSQAALAHPETKPVFAALKRKPQFEAGERGWSLVNACWLANASHLAYYEGESMERELSKVGLRLVDFYDKESTQAFIAASKAFAVLAFRGTQPDQLKDFKADADFLLTTFQDQAKVHRGFLNALDEVWSDIASALQKLTAQGLAIWYTGHSLGAALATLAAARLKPTALYTFGSPRVGNRAFAHLLDETPAYRLVNCCDMAARVPLQPMGYYHAGEHDFLTADARLWVNPGRWRIFGAQVAGTLKYWAGLPWLRGLVPARNLADHAIVNYTAALTNALSDVAERTG